jgi:hypothetical protein
MHFQAPIATENDVSTIVATFYRTPEKPTVDCGVSVASFPFSTAVDVEPAPPMLLPMLLPSESTAKPAIDCSVPFSYRILQSIILYYTPINPTSLWLVL